MNMLEISQVSKSFGTHQVLKDLSLSVPEHSIFGFIGQNGAGKTTTMKMIVGLLKQDSGTIKVNGVPVTYGQNYTNQFIGYLPDVPEFYSYMKPDEYLALCGKITGLDAKLTKERSKELLSLVGLEKNKRKIGGFSRGMKQRLGIAQALLNKPKLLICDEPTSALDPIGRKELLDILKKASKETTIIFSTHILSDVERICDRIAVLNEGCIALSGTLEDMKKHYQQDTLEIEFTNSQDMEYYLNSPVLSKYKEKYSLDMNDAGEVNSLYLKTSNVNQLMFLSFNICEELGICPLRICVMEPTLETLFLEVIKG